MSVQKKGLGSKGRGLEALISRTENISEKGVAEIDINKISPNREQPRSVFDEEALEVVFLLFLSAIKVTHPFAGFLYPFYYIRQNLSRKRAHCNNFVKKSA